jgi:hypothetical protein
MTVIVLKELSDQQTEMMVGGCGCTEIIIGYKNPGGKFFPILPGNSTSGKAKDNWTPVYSDGCAPPPPPPSPT